MKIPIYIAVFTEQNRHFNMFGQGYLPLFHTIFSISKIKSEVFNEVYSKFYGNENYEVIEEIDVINDYEDYGKVFTIKYVDKNYKDVYAIYKLEIVKEYIEK